MSKEFNKQIMIDNISFALKEFGKKIGELETEVGVSAGYISRTSKVPNAKPGIDFVVNVAEALDMSVDTLLNVDLAALTPNERYLISFFEKLIKDTEEAKLDWDIESPTYLNNLSVDMYHNCEHVLFDEETFMIPGEGDYPEEVTEVVFSSHSFGPATTICGDCFNMKMKNDAHLYLMNVEKAVHKVNDNDAYAREIWMHTPGCRPQYLCSDKERSEVSGVVNNLFETVQNYVKHPQIKSNLRYVIDAFMKDDVSNDAEYEAALMADDLPF